VTGDCSMPPRPIHRWPTFWLGILIIAFLSWAWARSITHDDLVRAHPGLDFNRSITSPYTNPWYILRSAGGFAWWETRRDSMGATTAPRFELHSETSSPTVSFPPPYTHYSATILARGDDYSFSYTAIAYWLLILLFLIPWISYLTWRWRRIKRLTTAS